MVGPRAARLPVGSAPWIAEERGSAQQIEQSEVEEFTFAARNEFDWLHEHMADIFSDSQVNVAEIFKTPGKLRGKTPRTARKIDHQLNNRAPLANLFSSSPKRVTHTTVPQDPPRSNTPDIFIRADSHVSPTRPETVPIASDGAKPDLVVPKPFSVIDSGYHGSQSQETVAMDDASIGFSDPVLGSTPAVSKTAKAGRVAFESSPDRVARATRQSPEPTTEAIPDVTTTQYFTAHGSEDIYPANAEVELESTTPTGSPVRAPVSSSSAKTSPIKTSPPQILPAAPQTANQDTEDHVLDDPSGSPSDGSSPIRPIVRKSSLTFASLPARQPMAHKSIGGQRTSRTSHIGLNRTSYYNRHTGGKSLGRGRLDLTDDEDEDAEMEDATAPIPKKMQKESAVVHNKTQTQRLQDQISMLGQVNQNASRPAKPAPGPSVPAQTQNNNTAAPQQVPQSKPRSPPKKPTIPGAFPEDDDDWMEPLGSPDDAPKAFSPRPVLPKFHTADVMEGVAGKDTVSGEEFAALSSTTEPERPQVPPKSPTVLGHHKAASVSVPVQSPSRPDPEDMSRLKKTISVSSANLRGISEDGRAGTPPKSPSRSFKDSPMKSVKKTLSSLFSRAKEIAASSDAVSAKTKSSLLSASNIRLGVHATPSTESVWRSGKDAQLYPDLSQHVENPAVAAPASPTRTERHRTRASLEREKAEEKRKEKEAKEARRVAEQMAKLDKAREQEREKARVYSQEQEKVAAMEEKVASQKQQENKTASQVAAPVSAPAPAPAAAPTPSQPQKPTRSSPRKAKPQTETEETRDVDMADAPAPMPPPSVTRSIAPPAAPKTREIKRPMRPEKDAAKTKQLPTVIRVNTGSQHSQFYPSNNTLATSLYDTLATAPQSESKIGQPSLQPKPSMQSLTSSTSSAAAGAARPRALTAAAKKKEQEEREAQRRREAKAELDRKRAAQEEDKRQEQQKKLDLERQREEERKQAEAKKNAHRQAMIEKAKQTRAPPPAKRNQPTAPPEHTQKPEPSSSRPPSRMAPAAARSQEDLGRSVHNAQKAPQKRTLQQSSNDTRPGTATTQSSESKRMRMTNELDDNMEVETQSTLKGAPVRPSGGFKKDAPTKSMFPAGYANAPASATRDLFKTSIAGQHSAHVKAGHPMEMAQLAKGPIPFAPNPNAAGPSQPHKTPARPAAHSGPKSAVKSSAKASPRFQNGEQIELPEINTDDETDDYDDGDKGMVASWADSSPLIRGLIDQERINPFFVFGHPAPLNMEEVFPKAKDRFHKFRQRTSSANWSGTDRLTTEEIQRDEVARERMRKDGAWTYEMSRDLI